MIILAFLLPGLAYGLYERQRSDHRVGFFCALFY